MQIQQIKNKDGGLNDQECKLNNLKEMKVIIKATNPRNLSDIALNLSHATKYVLNLNDMVDLNLTEISTSNLAFTTR